MLALLHALGLAHSTVMHEDRTRETSSGEVKVMIASSTVVHTVNHHVQNCPRELGLYYQGERQADDREGGQSCEEDVSARPRYHICCRRRTRH